MKKPNFFIIGAPKCGTTSLAEYLRSHPDVYFSTPKEPDHFNSDFPRKEILSDEEYMEKYFSGADHQKAVGEGSTHYLFSRRAVLNILSFNPDAKFIVMLRNPVELAESLYFEERSQLAEKAATFEEAWNLESDPSRAAEVSLHYGSIAKLGEQLIRLFDAVSDRSKILIIDFDKFINDTKAEYSKVLEFLGLEMDGRTQFFNAHPRREARSHFIEKVLFSIDKSAMRRQSAKVKNFLGITHWPLLGRLHRSLRKANLKISPHQPMNREFESTLYDYFWDDVEIVRALTGINLYENKKYDQKA